jgi:hypothetical protein
MLIWLAWRSESGKAEVRQKRAAELMAKVVDFILNGGICEDESIKLDR